MAIWMQPEGKSTKTKGKPFCKRLPRASVEQKGTRDARIRFRQLSRPAQPSPAVSTCSVPTWSLLCLVHLNPIAV